MPRFATLTPTCVATPPNRSAKWARPRRVHGRRCRALCQDPESAVRSHAVRALGELSPTKASRSVVLAALQDVDPQVRTAAVESIGQWGEGEGEAEADEGTLTSLMPLLDDANDQVKVQVALVLPKLAGANPAVIDGLCRRLLDDDSVVVQCSAAQALSKLGPAAAAAGASLLRTAQTMDVTVREQAMRAIAMIQPPEAGTAFASGLKDADGEIRKMASAGWRNAPAIPEEFIPALSKPCATRRSRSGRMPRTPWPDSMPCPPPPSPC